MPLRSFRFRLANYTALLDWYEPSFELLELIPFFLHSFLP